MKKVLSLILLSVLVPAGFSLDISIDDLDELEKDLETESDKKSSTLKSNDSLEQDLQGLGLSEEDDLDLEELLPTKKVSKRKKRPKRFKKDIEPDFDKSFSTLESNDILDSAGLEQELKELDFPEEDRLQVKKLRPKKKVSNLKKRPKKKSSLEKEFNFLEEEAKAKKELQANKRKQIEEKKSRAHQTKLIKKDLSDDKKFDIIVGKEEKELLRLSQHVQRKIPGKEWDEIATASKTDKYTIQKGESLWEISQKLFGTGFYYSKIWALNPYITNPHLVKPGMTLLFTTGDSNELPKVKLGVFKKNNNNNKKTDKLSFNFDSYGEGVTSPWLEERKKLIDEGTYFQYASEETYDDLKAIGNLVLTDEHKKYFPPIPDIQIKEPDADQIKGFSKESIVRFNIKEGFYLKTFVTSNVVQDIGEVVGIKKKRLQAHLFDRIYIKFNDDVNVKPNDLFSAYLSGGIVSHKVSDRKGYRYTIAAQIKVIKKNEKLWEAEVAESTESIKKGTRITTYIPKIKKMLDTFNRRRIEAAIIGTYRPRNTTVTMGDVVYLDRGRIDGVEIGNIFNIYTTEDKTLNKLTSIPRQKIGEIRVITLMDNFSTGLIINAREVITLGNQVFSKTLDDINKEFVLEDKNNNQEQKADLELNLENLNKDLLKDLETIKLTDHELEELQNQEKTASIISDHEKDLHELEKLEKEMVLAENSLQESKIDEDKFLEQQNLNTIEQENKGVDADAFPDLTDLEEEIGRKYLDQNLNSKENPYGLTEFDLEEVDELLNSN